MWLGVLRNILYTLAALMICAAAFVVGAAVARQTARPVLPQDKTAVSAEQMSRARELVEKALAERFAGANAKAIELFDEAAAADPSLAGIDLQKGLCLFQTGDFAKAEAAANASLAKDEKSSDAYALLIMCAAGRARAGEKTDSQRVADWATKSRAKDPLAPFVHYAMGEYSRATGQPREAVAHYGKALERVSSVDSFLVATVKAGLSKLRLEQNSDNKPVMPWIDQDPVPPEWLFFAAAQALLDGDKPTARAFLVRAEQVVSPEIFNSLLQDSFFQDYMPEGIPNDPPAAGSP